MTTLDVTSLFSQVLSHLSEKERFIVSSRIGLSGARKTLQEIGDAYSITRERVRQIEDVSVKKISNIVKGTALYGLQELARVLVDSAGGVMTRDRLIGQVVSRLQLDPSINPGILEVILQSDFDLAKSKPQLFTNVYFHAPAVSRKCIEAIRKEALRLLKKRGDIMEREALYALVRANLVPLWPNLDSRLADSVMDVYHDFVKGEERYVGLAEWNILNPKTLRDKAVYVLRKSKEPMHFVDIANKIGAAFGQPVKVNTVHNELIRNEDFILIGRGIYALKAWGYQPGTVLDVIVDLFKKSGNQPLSADEVISRVLKVRQVKTNTVYMNLQNKKAVERVGRNLYRLRKEGSAKAA